MKNIQAIFIKQIRSMIKMPLLIGQGIMFIIMIVVMSFLLGPDRECPTYTDDRCVEAHVCEACLRDNPIHSLPTPTMAGLFSVMFMGMVLISCSSALVQEDKTTHNLRFMTMSGMKPHQYLIGTGAALFMVAIALLLLYALAGRHFGIETLHFLALTAAGALVSILFGIAMGLSKAPWVATPISMAFGFGPMFSTFNENLARWLHFTYTQQVNLGIYHIQDGLQQRTFLIIGITALVILLAFVWMHRKGELRW
ncbi:MAG: ABC transporter permease [Defluviitaleaceae bacterium]|nr:ABC transporter permease [Defluviitaleaceae bacterium]MCL2275202.1 ABC transporter permease [Defluviitaleaceae bacterium]